MIWAGSDDGLVHVTRDDGKTWQNVTPKGIPEWIQINSIEVSPRDKGNGLRRGDDVQVRRLPSLPVQDQRLREDAGRRSSTGSRTAPSPASIREDPVRQGLLYAGTETGLYVSFDDGASWQSFQRNLPHTPITDLAVKNGDLVVATQGRAFWILDDLTALRKWSDGGRGLGRLPLPAAARPCGWTSRSPTRTSSRRRPEQNPPAGVVVDYWLKDKPEEGDKVTLEFLDGDTRAAGLTRTKSRPSSTTSTKQAAARRGREGQDKPLEPKAGREPLRLGHAHPASRRSCRRPSSTRAPKRRPRSRPGTYTVRLTVGGKAHTREARGPAAPGRLRHGAGLSRRSTTC